MAMKARFSCQQPPVKVVESDGTVYVFICLNEQHGIESYPDMGDGQTTEDYYEYDYNEIIGDADKLPLENIQQYPENYLEYEYNPKPANPGERALKEIEELKATIERGLTL